MSEQLTTLEDWARRRFAVIPSQWTLRKWAREGKIVPRPRKHGRTYYVPVNAQYMNYNDPGYAEAVRESTTTQ